ncbi:vitelline membrane outer layer protein 1 homolog [Daphnia pulex]|uniref:vitelline membrane outer layer protein 1 homolog n=1 Tax=Daphnia pulex TaxID=6669 RepID=UPI001EDF78D4|nr:vitelline membrane outer layer protein 1 homolog [Daphnia pulex]
MVKPVRFFAFTAVLGCFLPVTKVTATFWGDWGKAEYCPLGEWVIGFALKTEKPQGEGDDTALNSISLKCSGGSLIYSTQAPWGDWGSNFICPAGSWLDSCQLRVESQLGDGDDTAANNLNCKCSNGETLRGDGASWGDWKEWTSPCRDGFMAIRTRVEEPQASGDDTALNDVEFICWEKRDSR